MLYRAIGLMSGSSLDGLDIVFASFNEQGGKWSYEFLQTACYPYENDWAKQLSGATSLSAKDYLLLDTSYGHYLGEQVNRFINEHQLHYQVALVASHGHTSFHIPDKKMTAQLGDGAAIAASTQLTVVNELRALDIAFGGQGAPIVPIGEKLLLGDYGMYLNIGGIANISFNDPDKYIAFDICPANRVLNMLAKQAGMEYDKGGALAATGVIDQTVLQALNDLPYYQQTYPKSLANDFGVEEIFPLLQSYQLSVNDALRTYAEHISIQISNAIGTVELKGKRNLLATGGGAFNDFLMQLLKDRLSAKNIELIIPDAQLINYKEALIMAFIGVLRWRQEYNVLSSVTGASRPSIGGALWTGQEA